MYNVGSSVGPDYANLHTVNNQVLLLTHCCCLPGFNQEKNNACEGGTSDPVFCKVLNNSVDCSAGKLVFGVSMFWSFDHPCGHRFLDGPPFHVAASSTTSRTNTIRSDESTRTCGVRPAVRPQALTALLLLAKGQVPGLKNHHMKRNTWRHQNLELETPESISGSNMERAFAPALYLPPFATLVRCSLQTHLETQTPLDCTTLLWFSSVWSDSVQCSSISTGRPTRGGSCVSKGKYTCR